MGKIAEMDSAEIFLPEETRLIKKSLDIREQMVDKLIEDGIPKDTRKIRVINEVLNSIDSLVLGKVDRRLKHGENQNQQDMVELVKEVLLAVEKQKTSVGPIEIPEIEPLSPDELVPGEDKIEYEELDISDFTD